VGPTLLLLVGMSAFLVLARFPSALAWSCSSRSNHRLAASAAVGNARIARAPLPQQQQQRMWGSIVALQGMPTVRSPFSSSSTRRFLASSRDDSSKEDKPKKTTKPKSAPKKKKKFVINPNISQEQASQNLAKAFDDLARKEGFASSSKDSTQIFFANDSTFDEAFEDDDFMDDEDEFEGDDDDDDSPALEKQQQEDANYWGDSTVESDGGAVVGQAPKSVEEEKGVKSPKQQKQPAESIVLGDAKDYGFDDEEEEDDDDGDDYLDFGSDDNDDDMEARLADAKRDIDRGQVTLDPAGLGGEITKEDMRRLGFRQELNPFEGDATPRQEEFKLITNSMTCSACGSDFQSRNESKPGYLPPEKYEIQVKLSEIEELQKLKQKAETADWTPEDEVEWLLQTSGDGGGTSQSDMVDIDIDAEAEKLGIDLADEMTKTKRVICKRCHGLQNFGTVDDALRPGWTDEPMMSQQQFKDLLRPLSEKPAVLIAIVDLFDFSGSVLPELDAIAGDNPVILAANKADLLPPKMGQQRAENWVRRELEYMGVKSLANIGGAVRLISCKTGMGIKELLSKARKLAEEMDCDVYVVGAANAGKSTLMNYILRGQEENKPDDKRKKRAGNENARKGVLTTSPLPGTTLKFIKVDLGEGRSIYDTPGLLVPGTLTQLLTADELKIVVPNK